LFLQRAKKRQDAASTATTLCMLIVRRMTDPQHHQLLGHLLGALDDDEQRCLDAQLEQDEQCCQELARWRRRLAPLEAMRPDFEPPPGLAERTCRFVASCVAETGSQTCEKGPKMTPLPAPSSYVGPIGWLDVVAVALLLMTLGTVVPPAIDISRFESRLVSCQDALRRFGLALSQYGHDQRSPVGQLADNGRLTRAGVVAGKLLRNAYLADDPQNACPNVWLTAQGGLCGSGIEPTQTDKPPLAVTAVAGVTAPQTAVAQAGGARAVGDPFEDWPGRRRDGTNDGWRVLPSPAEVPLLADAPSADLRGPDFASHGGLGRNVYFRDGRVGFLPSTRFVGTGERLLSLGETPARLSVSAPIVLISGH
jgi:hypothetical protein